MQPKGRLPDACRQKISVKLLGKLQRITLKQTLQIIKQIHGTMWLFKKKKTLDLWGLCDWLMTNEKSCDLSFRHVTSLTNQQAAIKSTNLQTRWLTKYILGLGGALQCKLQIFRSYSFNCPNHGSNAMDPYSDKRCWYENNFTGKETSKEEDYLSRRRTRGRRGS